MTDPMETVVDDEKSQKLDTVERLDTRGTEGDRKLKKDIEEFFKEVEKRDAEADKECEYGNQKVRNLNWAWQYFDPEK